MRPMSWYGGSQLTLRLSGPAPTAPLIIAELWVRLSCRTMTPLGVPTDPEVYWRNARSVARGPWPRQACAASSGTSSVASTVNCPPAAANSGLAPSSARLAASPRATAAPASVATASMVARPRRPTGTWTGTATTPAYRQPKNPIT